MPENRFNLIDEPWIPIADVGRVSLRQIFSEPNYRALGGNAVQKIALTKLLLAIAQAAYTPTDDDDWRNLGADGMAKFCLDYLNKWHDRFWLYGERPFLQMPAINVAAIQLFGAVMPDISTGNTTVLTQSQVQKPLCDAEKAVLIVVLMGFGLGGKKTDNSIVLTPGYTGKTKEGGKGKTGSPGPAVGHMGFAHAILVSKSLQLSLWANLFTYEQIAGFATYPHGLGEPPWECMPTGEDCECAGKLKNSLMGRLIPVSRFCLLADEGLHYSEGIAYMGYKEGMRDPTVAVNYSGKDAKALWIDAEKRPWRQLTALLAFVSSTGQKGLDCPQIRLNLIRARKQLTNIGIWIGGLSVSSNAGEQYASGTDDFVESELVLDGSTLSEEWFEHLKSEMEHLETSLAKSLYGCVIGYAKAQNLDGGGIAAQATNLFWQQCETQFQKLIEACDAKTHKTLRRVFAGFADKTYNLYCPKDTARQLDAWAKNKPNFSRYLADL